MPNKVWDEITYPFPNVNGAAADVWKWISYFRTHFVMDVIAYHAGISLLTWGDWMIRFNIVNIMVADAMTPYVAMSSEAIILTMYNRLIPGLLEEGFQLPV